MNLPQPFQKGVGARARVRESSRDRWKSRVPAVRFFRSFMKRDYPSPMEATMSTGRAAPESGANSSDSKAISIFTKVMGAALKVP